MGGIGKWVGRRVSGIGFLFNKGMFLCGWMLGGEGCFCVGGYLTVRWVIFNWVD